MNAFVEGDEYFSRLWPLGVEGEAYIRDFFRNCISPTHKNKTQDVQVLVVGNDDDM